ncbi:Processing alpha glucosidase I [Haplosporangium sp. Z 11]|nr:Processing alpha glucosidase I [Haplosporangium sp. Z 11]
MHRSRTKNRNRFSFFALALVGATFTCLSSSAQSAADPAMDPTNAFLNNIGMLNQADDDISITASAAQNQSLLWGIYRPNLYFGTRPRLPDSLLTGLMWYGTQDYTGLENIRHGCEEKDGFEKYGWLKNDGRTFGVQQLKDTRNNVELTTEFIKVPGGDHGGSWGARISGKPIKPDEPMSITTIYYVGLDGEGQIDLNSDNFNAQSPVQFGGKTKDLGDFGFTLEYTKGANKADPMNFCGVTVPRGTVWRAKEFGREVVFHGSQILRHSGRTDIMPKELLSLPNQFFSDNPNMIFLQMHHDSEFEFEIRFDSGSASNPMTSEVISTELAKAEGAFDERFEEKFQLKQQGYSEPMINFAKATLSNLIGGIGYFHGSAIVDDSPVYDDGENDHLEGPVARRPSPNPHKTEPASLFSAVPSRSFFPRGFYWDEGFHQTLIGQWDNDLSLEIIESWYNRQDSDGWIQREQILGDEARSRVPEEFQVQYPEHANPPTLLQAISGYLDRLRNVSNVFAVGAFGDSQQVHFGDGHSTEKDVTNTRLLHPVLAQEYLTKLYPKLRTNYFWMRRTMQGGIREYGRQSRSRVEGYRWRGRTMTHTLTSGLDDYPRAAVPSVAELHVDLLSWIGFMGRQLQYIAQIIGEEDDAEEYEDHYKAIVNNIDDLHWSEDNKAYCDVTVDETSESIHVCHKGYVSLYPVLLGLVDPNSEKLGHVLDLMSDPEELWTPYGLRSLSAKDELFGTGENYWKGPIWINLNFLAVHSLKNTYFVEGPYQSKAKKIYNELRDNLINNIYKEYERTGYVWEQYNEETGQGQRSHPFTGWTSTIVLIMQMGRAE